MSESQTQRWEQTTDRIMAVQAFGELREYAVAAAPAAMHPGIDSLLCVLTDDQPVAHAESLGTCLPFVSRNCAIQVELAYHTKTTIDDEPVEYAIEFSGPLDVFTALDPPVGLDSQVDGEQAAELYFSVPLTEVETIDGTQTDILAKLNSILADTNLLLRARAGGPRLARAKSTTH